MTTIPLSARSLHGLSADLIEQHIRDFLCDDAASPHANDQILSRTDFFPDTFTASDRLQGTVYLTMDELDGRAWLRKSVVAELRRLEQQNLITMDSELDVVDFCLDQVHRLLDHILDGRPVASTLANQEMPDVIRKVLGFCIQGDPSLELYSHKRFNELALQIIPTLIENHLLARDVSAKELLMYSIASGLIGLDLKGSAAAAANFATLGIRLAPLLGSGIHEIAAELWHGLNECVTKGLALDHWDLFVAETEANNCHIVWFPDDYIESFFDLMLIQKLMAENSSLRVSFVPKRGRHGNDLAFSDVAVFLRQLPFVQLAQEAANGRFMVSPHGPSLGTVSLRKLAPQVARAVQECNLVFIKGCRSHEMMQGGLARASYTAYVVAREFSESESGFDARGQPMLFFRAAPGEYMYWGFGGRAVRRKRFGDGREICICHSTIEEHEARKSMVEPDSILQALDQLLALNRQSRVEYVHPFREECRLLVDKIDTVTRASYDLVAQKYRDVRGVEPCAQDVEHFNRLLGLVRERVMQGRLGSPRGKIRLLDVGTGSGRDLRYFTRFADLEAVGVDNCSNFIAILDELANDGLIPPGSYFQMDMRDLREFEDRAFDVVRHNATLLHLAMIDTGIGVDAALAESYRVLMPGGLLFVTVKVGNGMQLVDTGEGLGKRFFQFFSEGPLSEVLERNGFRILEMHRWSELRKSGAIDWLVAYAEKPATLAYNQT